ncbi:SsrA-binding protein [Lutimonas zeaxanthinifaciens]|uniref:SsrA-binding protein n=1 Tax=Lutimonas zeaxanthinifaciens TaxID=3060215 RepID=UPI00265D2C79|nr:SsrA-binding protein [Lutimonas sp. YSD2104]WKK66525.1 SsrA-binding protein [Lutimonas sp. YSD2104]
MKKQLFKLLASINKAVLPSLGKREVDMSKAKKWQMALIGWRYYVTRNSLD